MINEFSKVVGNKILRWFLSHPTAPVNINELAHELEISSGSVKRFVDLFYRVNLVNIKKVGAVNMFTLNNFSY
ncbi:DNA polymerase subunit beta, partial [Methanosarcina barkeri]|uniref:HTH iclR-type domain-containing protein n=1 Tax=Methanosarcina barkeri 227 TaxID=1434106 RepID=A0A0E3QYD2_METBA